MRFANLVIPAVAFIAACSELPGTPTTPQRPSVSEGGSFAVSSTTTAIDLGTLGGSYSAAYGINVLGHVIGYAYRADNVEMAALWDPTVHALDLPPGATSGLARGVNANDVVVGVATISRASQAVEWTPSGTGSWSATVLPGLAGSVQAASYAYGINASGDVTGAEALAGGGTVAVLWHQGVACKLSATSGADPAAMTPRAINDNGWIAGFASINGGSAVLFVPSSSSAPCVGQLIVLPRDATASGSHYANSVNTAGTSVGWAVAGKTYHALRWSLKAGVSSPTGTQDFAVSVLPAATNGGSASGISDDGVVAGDYYGKGSLFSYDGAMWSASNVFTSLAPIAGYKNAEALSIAVVGGAHWAVGDSKSSTQPAHATLWKMP